MQKTTSKKSKTIKKKSKGLGDTVETVLEKTGVSKIVKFIGGDDCGCEKRKEALNKLFPYNQPECLKENEYNFLKEFFSIQRNTVTYNQQLELIAITEVQSIKAHQE